MCLARAALPDMVGPPEPVLVTTPCATGAVKATGSFLDGVMHGAWERLRLDGTVMRTGRFDRGRQVGVWRTFGRSGRLVKESDFSARPPA
jgi:antitoxin component YwqK of YwqJK toxin-antitoxin module